jgi:TatA/E family protein of Tat protein translocase
MFNVGFPEMAVIAGMALLVFGPKRTQELAQALGKGVRDFRKAMDTDSTPESPPGTPPSAPQVSPAEGIESRWFYSDKRGMRLPLLLKLIVVGTFALGGGADAAYRVFKLKVTTYDPKNRPKKVRIVLSTVDHLQYQYFYNVALTEKVELLDHWYCPGDTGNYRALCKPPKEKKTAGRKPASAGEIQLPLNRQPIIPWDPSLRSG